MQDKPLKRPESVLVVVYTAELDVLLLHRTHPMDFWQSVTGSMRWEEADPLDTARRELMEETGLPGEGLESCQASNRFVIKPEWRARYGPDVDENLEHVFRLRLPTRLPVMLNPDEHTDYLWLPKTEAAAKVWSWTNREAVERFVE